MTPAPISSNDLNSARQEFSRLIKEANPYYKVGKRVSPLSSLEQHLPESIQAVFKLYEFIEILHDDVIGSKHLKLNRSHPEFTIIGLNSAVCEYAVRRGDERIYTLDYELHPDEFKPLYPSIYHWFIDSVRVAKEVDEESLNNNTTLISKVKKFFRW